MDLFKKIAQNMGPLGQYAEDSDGRAAVQLQRPGGGRRQEGQGVVRVRQEQRSAAGRGEGDQGRRADGPAGEAGFAPRQDHPAPRDRQVRSEPAAISPI